MVTAWGLLATVAPTPPVAEAPLTPDSAPSTEAGRCSMTGSKLALTCGSRAERWMRYWAWASAMFSTATRRSRLLSSASWITCWSLGLVKKSRQARSGAAIAAGEAAP